ncbi:MAG: hypothetical protein FJ104_09095, partial [Deltaproteobacteria bacterium]|nr:hypothetical protein [Deltaproteobacteria bacterium]
AAGCAPAKVVPPAAPPALLPGGPLEHLPGAGLRFIVGGDPSRWLTDPTLAAEIDALLPRVRRDAFTATTAVDLARVTRGYAARYSLAEVHAAELAAADGAVADRLVERLSAPAARESPHPALERVVGVSSGRPFALLVAERQFALVATGDPSLARIVELRLLGRLRRLVPVKESAGLRQLPPGVWRAPLFAAAPGPLDAELGRAGRGLAAASEAVALSVTPGPQGLDVEVLLAGVFRAEDPTVLEGAWDDLAESGPGRLLGLDRPVVPRAASLESFGLALRLRLDPRPLLAGLRAAVVAETQEILGIPGIFRAAPAGPGAASSLPGAPER